jgi:hypothetical protein
VPVIIWIKGGFGAGKTVLAEELRRRLLDAIVYDPEDAGLMLWKWMRPNGDFQHLPSWRELAPARRPTHGYSQGESTGLGRTFSHGRYDPSSATKIWYVC